MSPWRQADHNGRDERLTYLSCDMLREAIHPPVGLPPTGGQAHQVHGGIAAIVCLDS
jgi:hypothetical protein